MASKTSISDFMDMSILMFSEFVRAISEVLKARSEA